MGYALCEEHRKRIYPDMDSAFHAALASSRAFGKPFRVYECSSTGQHHITSQRREIASGV